MTAEYLLDAIGLLDDDLIQDAEQLPVRRIEPWRRWGTWAACAALVIALGYGAAHLPMGGSSASSSASADPDSPIGISQSSATASSAADAYEANQSEITVSSGASSSDNAAHAGFLYVGGSVYAPTGNILDALPENCRSLGVLSALYPDCPYPAADMEEYVGCELWAEGEDTVPAAVYIQLPEGGYAAAELVQP